MRALTTREWMTVGIGGALVVIVLVWTQLISPGTDKLESNSKRLADLNKNIAIADKKISQGANLAKEYKNLTERYSNALETINAQKMPDNLARTLREEFAKLDGKYGSSITSTAVKQPQTNDMYSDFSYNLKDVRCDWKSLNAALGLIESAGQLVGFDAMKIKSNLKDPNNPQAVVDMSVRSFVFNDSQDQDLPNWKAPDYDSLTSDLKSDIFALPKEVAAAVGVRGRREELAEPGERVAAVEVVGVDRGERRVDDVARRANRVRGAPRLRAPRRDGVRRGEVVQVLEGVRDLHHVLVLRADLLAEHVLEVLADDEHALAEPGALRVEHGIVEYGLAGRTHRIHLLKPSVPGSHSRGQHDQRRLHFAHLSLLASFLMLLLT